MKTKVKVIYLLISMFIISCNSEETTETNSNENVEIEDSVIYLSNDQLEFMDIKTQKVEKIYTNPIVSTNGTLELPPENKARISTLMGGVIKNIRVHQGENIKRGQVLAYIDSPEFINLQEDYLVKLNELELLKSEYERAEKLSKDQINSKKNLQEAKSAYNESQIMVTTIGSKLKMLNVNLEGLENGKILQSIPIISMISGTVDKINVNLGQYIAPGDELFEVVNNDHMHIELMAYQKDISGIKPGQKVSFKTSSIPNKQFEGVIFSISQQVDNNSGGLRIHAELENKDQDLKAGMYLSAEIVLDSSEVNAVPSSAIVEDGEASYVFVELENKQNEKRKFVRKQVLVQKLGNNQSALTFLDQNDRNDPIVVNGVFLLMAEMNKEM